MEKEKIKAPTGVIHKGEMNLEELYSQYFKAPAENQPDDLEQVTLFDYSIATHSSDSTADTAQETK